MNKDIHRGTGKVLSFFATNPKIAPDESDSILSVAEKKRTASGAYCRNWSLYNETQTNELEHFQRMLQHLCFLPVRPRQQRGQPWLDFRGILFILVYSAYFSQMAKRRFVSQLKVAAEQLGIEQIPHFNSMYNYLKNEEFTIYLREMLVASSLPLVVIENHFLADSSGFSTSNFKEWKKVKYGNSEQWRVWTKLHVMCGARTKIITAAEISPEYQHDSPFFEPLFEQTRKYFQVEKVSADKAYSSYKNVKLLISAGTLSLIKFKDNARGDTKHEAGNKAYHYFSLNQEEFLRQYHQRSNVESLFSAMKEKFGERLRSKIFSGQTNELLCKAICHNLCVLVRVMYEFRIEPTLLFPPIDPKAGKFE